MEKEEIKLDDLKDNKILIKTLKDKVEKGEKLKKEELDLLLDSIKDEPLDNGWIWILILILMFGFTTNKPEKQVIINM